MRRGLAALSGQVQRDAAHVCRAGAQQPRAAQQRGYSLLETVCVTTMLGCMSAVAVPRFTDLPGDARVAVVRHMEGVVREASAMAHMGCAVNALCDLRAGSAVVTVQGEPVRIERGYPAAGTAAGIAATVEFTGFAVAQVDGQTVFRKTGAPREAACAVVYEGPAADGGMPSIQVLTGGC